MPKLVLLQRLYNALRDAGVDVNKVVCDYDAETQQTQCTVWLADNPYPVIHSSDLTMGVEADNLQIIDEWVRASRNDWKFI